MMFAAGRWTAIMGTALVIGLSAGGSAIRRVPPKRAKKASAWEAPPHGGSASLLAELSDRRYCIGVAELLAERIHRVHVRAETDVRDLNHDLARVAAIDSSGRGLTLAPAHVHASGCPSRSPPPLGSRLVARGCRPAARVPWRVSALCGCRRFRNEHGSSGRTSQWPAEV
jgi:hypothetical protein